MSVSYPIFQNGQSAGTAQVSLKGLYYEISCCCNLPEGTIYRITVTGSDGSVNLGVCVRNGSKFVIHTHVPVKRLGKGNLQFQINGDRRIFAEIKEGKRFSYLPAVIQSYLSYKEGKPGIWITPE